jgi:NAD(P)H dehydrogenase (quinone)
MVHIRDIFRNVIFAAAFVLTIGQIPPAASQSITVLVAYHSATGNTEKMAHGVAEGVKAVSGASVVVKRVGEVAIDDLLASDAVIIGSPVYFGNMSAEVKIFLEKWASLFQERKMRNKLGGVFTTGGSFSNGKELTMLSMLGAMLMHQMIVVSGGGAFGASATTGPDSPGIDEKELAEANALGKRIAEVAMITKRGNTK